ncbi:Tmtc4 [Scenedesmus sp. PABB004]|nr:Tmtc4 [Scenedesmus sp. PABB004]
MAPPRGRWRGLLVGLLAVAAYTNTLIGDFTFDDNFAVISNGDVTSDANPVAGLFRHDFWGQDIASSQSHKSYRPVTILVFRWTRQAWGWATALAPWLEAALPAPPPLPQQAAAAAAADPSASKARPPGLHPFPFHVLSVALHAAASVLVLVLADHLFAKLELATGAAGCSASSDGSVNASASAAAAAAAELAHAPGGPVARWLMWRWQPRPWLAPATCRGRQQALVAALLFALHPIHTEAVAGVVGCAELICAVCSLPALLLYAMAVDGRHAAAALLQAQRAADSQAADPHGAAGGSSAGGAGSNKAAAAGGGARPRPARGPQAPPAASGGDARRPAGAAACAALARAEALQHWALVAAAAGLALVAALSKEIGITITGTMVAYDLLLAPHMAAHGAASGGGDLGACRRQAARVAALAGVTLGYVRLRQWVAVQQLVAIYRKVENPIPFAGSAATRLLSTAHLHARYAGLLLAPVHMSADWSFHCIPLVTRLGDPRNLAAAALYTYLAALVLAADPPALARQLAGAARAALPGRAAPAPPAGPAAAARAAAGAPADGAPARRVAAARWRLAVATGLVVGPFLPASNVLFYVGTFIGERLLYTPSIGAALLAAEAVGAALPDGGGGGSGDGGDSSDSGGGAAAPRAAPGGRARRARGVVAWLCIALVLAAFGARTLRRNADWWDEERLFLAALRVCPDSAKVQQNCGVLQRRYQNFSAALSHFRRAQEIEPGYCEPTYWIGLTTINTGDLRGGLAGMRDSLSCKYTAAEALAGLNKIYLMLHGAAPTDPGPLIEWAGVLGCPAVLRVADACAVAEDGALLAATVGKAPAIRTALDVCVAALDTWQAGGGEPDTLAGLARQRYAGLNATLLAKCVALRRPLYAKLAAHGPKARETRRAIYRYIAKVAARYPDCRTAGAAAPSDGDDAAAAAPPPHLKLLHRVQSADPEDPWLQLEWGESLIAHSGGAGLRDAAMHLEVASAMFMRAHQQLSAGGGVGVTALDGAALTPESALEAAAQPLESFRAAVRAGGAPPSGPGAAGYCELLKRLCHLRLQQVVLAQQAQAAEQQGDAGAAQHTAMAALNAKADARRCLLELTERRGCEAAAEEIRRLVGRGAD